MKYIKAHKSRIHDKRSKSIVKCIVIHYTGNDNDTAKNNCDYFSRYGNGDGVGAHFFIDSSGTVIKSIPMNRVAWSVGGFFTKSNGAGKYYNKFTNKNTVSIELCNAKKGYTSGHIKGIKKCLKYIRKYCKNANVICRHWDINGKSCPGWACGSDNNMWKKLLNEIGE